jgi:hypothetical protein
VPGASNSTNCTEKKFGIGCEGQVLFSIIPPGDDMRHGLRLPFLGIRGPD